MPKIKIEAFLPDKWSTVKGYGDFYAVTPEGSIYSRKWGMWKQMQLSEHKGYRRITLSKNNERIIYPVHVLVARAFIPNPKKKPFVNHKDGNKRNNEVSNLEWCTHAENQKHSREVLGNTNLGERNGNHGYRKSKFFPSQELRNRLVELGVPRNKHDIVSLGEMLPFIVTKDYEHYIFTEKFTAFGEYIIEYINEQRDTLHFTRADTEAEARGAMLCYLLENELITL